MKARQRPTCIGNRLCCNGLQHQVAPRVAAGGRRRTRLRSGHRRAACGGAARVARRRQCRRCRRADRHHRAREQPRPPAASALGLGRRASAAATPAAAAAVGHAPLCESRHACACGGGRGIRRGGSARARRSHGRAGVEQLLEICGGTERGDRIRGDAVGDGRGDAVAAAEVCVHAAAVAGARARAMLGRRGGTLDG